MSAMSEVKREADVSTASPSTSNGLKLKFTMKNDQDDTEDHVEDDSARRAEARQRHEADLAEHAYEPPRPDRVQDDWQVAYVWAFIVKFGMMPKITKLECLGDFEQCLLEPIPNRPDDVLEGILVRFLHNLKPGLRNLDCTNVQSHLSNYISDMLLNSHEFTVWDRPWAPNEEPRASCCNSDPHRTELGRLRHIGEELGERVKRNPLKQMEERGGGLFELDWFERARLLRQLVDWQLSHAEVIRATIKDSIPTGKRAKDEPEKENDTFRIEPKGHDRNKQRIWSLDSSARLYQSGNPFKRPCPLVTITTTRAELQAQQEKWAAYGASTPPPAPKGVKGKKPAVKEVVAYRKLTKGLEEERKLADMVAADIVPKVEKEEMRVQRARKKIIDNMRIMQAAELRTTRTRRSSRKVDYTYSDYDDDEDEPRRGARGTRADVAQSYDPGRARPVIPGERRSARNRGGAMDDEASYGGSEVNDTASAAVSAAASPEPTPQAVEVEAPDGSKKVKGYAWIEETVPEAANGANGTAMNVDA